MSHQREVFPGLDSGPNGSEGHYFYALEKRPSGDSLYTTTRLILCSVGPVLTQNCFKCATKVVTNRSKHHVNSSHKNSCQTNQYQDICARCQYIYFSFCLCEIVSVAYRRPISLEAYPWWWVYSIDSTLSAKGGLDRWGKVVAGNLSIVMKWQCKKQIENSPVSTHPYYA